MYSEKARLNRLWYNTGNNTFPAQTISVNYSTERFLFICFRADYNNSEYVGSVVPCGTLTARVENHLNIGAANAEVYVVKRGISLSSSGITFSDAVAHIAGSTTSVVDNTRLVPYYIWGIY